ncbi:sulfatase-like hydrolase/transferase [Pedobacter sp. LMG 31464]|uniref:Sulfatase-like hydrolase/transferase n=1 Tax=Pedobacter planticolens TaxID=2679964 RepID=A0A923DW80_9SPHI|nr:alkaline phosphatase family protein [Pedobacter planticolens]MBB2144205.1 sulfatase-like hydrolase/transferase [Pedobacter planticolens]
MKPILKREQSIYVALIYRFLVLLLLYTLCRLGFYLTNRSLFNHIPFADLLYIFAGGIKFDIVALLYINSLYIVLQAIPFPFRYRNGYQQFCKWLFIITNSIGFLANFIDFAYYKYTLKHTTASVFSQFSNEQNKLKLVVDFSEDYWYLLILFIIFIYVFIKLYQVIRIQKAPKFTWYIYLTHTLALVLIAGLSVIGMRGGWRHSTRPITMSNAGDFVKSPSDMSLVLNTPFTIMKTLKATTLKPINYYNQQTLDSLYTPIHQPENKGPFKKLNVVFLIIESLGKEHIGALNKDLLNGTYKGYTPFIDSLVVNSFTSSHTYANGRKSIDALPSIISGIPSIREPFVLSSYSGNKTTSIAKLLGDEGYQTAFFHGAPNGSMGFSAYTNLAGIKKYYGKTEYNNDADFDGIWGIWDEPFMQYMAKTINTFKQPFFSAFFSVSSHHPFKVPEKYIGKFPKGPLPVQEPIGYTDMAIKKFFATASKMPWYKNTLFVLCADHATVSYLPEYQTTPGYFSIPILFYYPGGDLKGKTDKLIQQADIMPTVLNYLNYDKPYFAFGFDAFSTKNNNFVVNNNDGSFSFYQGDYLLINDGLKSNALFNLKTDRLTKNNLVNKAPEVQNSMEKYLKAFIQQYNNRMIKDQLTAK